MPLKKPCHELCPKRTSNLKEALSAQAAYLREYSSKFPRQPSPQLLTRKPISNLQKTLTYLRESFLILHLFAYHILPTDLYTNEDTSPVIVGHEIFVFLQELRGTWAPFSRECRNSRLWVKVNNQVMTAEQQQCYDLLGSIEENLLQTTKILETISQKALRGTIFFEDFNLAVGYLECAIGLLPSPFSRLFRGLTKFWYRRN